MRQLESLLFSLGPAERSRIRPLQFRGQKRTLFLRLLRCRTPEEVRRLHAWLDQTIDVQKRSPIYSQMLRACYEDLIPNGGVELLLFLGDKHLFQNLLSELRFQESALANDPEALARFYESVLVMRHELVLDSKQGARVWTEIDRIADKYRPLAPDGTDVAALGRVLSTVREMTTLTHGKFVLPDVLERFELLEREIAALPTEGNVVAKFIAADCLRLQQVHDPERKQRVQEYGRLVLELVERYPHTFGDCGPLIRLSCLRGLPEGAGLLTTTHIKEFLTERAVNRAFPLFHVGLFLGALLAAGEGPWLDHYLHTYCPRRLELMAKEPAFSISILQAIRRAYAADVSEGERYLQFACKLVLGSRMSVATQLLMRSLEIYFVILRGDLELAENLVARDLRYARTYGQHLARRPPVMFIRLTAALLRALPFEKDKAFKLRDEFVSSSESPVYRMLFTNMVDVSFGERSQALVETQQAGYR